jgi:hypothetical protein
MLVPYYKPFFMKSTVLTAVVFLLAGTVMNAQLSFLPQVGFEQSRTTVNYNALSTSGLQGNFKAGLKIDYRFKGGHSPFVNVATSPAPMNFSFSESGSLLDNMQQAKANLRLRLEAGYQYSSSPIQLTKGGSASRSASHHEGATQKKSCGSSSYTSHCGQQKLHTRSTRPVEALSMRLQPSLGFAYVPAANEAIKSNGNGFQYDGAAWKTALVPAMGFEFAKGRQRLATVTVFYTKPLQQNEETFTGNTGLKPISTSLSSKASTWGLTLGVPFGFTKSNATKTYREKKECSRTYKTYKRCSRI